MSFQHIAETSADIDDPRAYNHQFAEVNGVRLHYVDEGQGPLVVLVHGFPYVWYSWRSQIRALAAAGYRAIALDLRGFGQSEQPAGVDVYDHTHLVGDLVDLVRALGETTAVLVGHDIGANLVNAAALMRPDVFRAVAAICTPPATRAPVKPSAVWAMMEKGNVFYQHYFQDTRADAEIAGDIRRFLLGLMNGVSGSATDANRCRIFVEPGETILDIATLPDQMPPWLSEQAQDYYVDEFTRTGFTGVLHHYRCRDLNWELTSFLDGAVIRQPGICIMGADDPVFPAVRGAFDNLERHMTDLRGKVVLPGVGHAAAEEQPAKVNELLLGFLGRL